MFASENQRFKDAVNEYAHQRLKRHLAAGETAGDMVASFCPNICKGVIYKQWLKCLTSSDVDEMQTHLTETESWNIENFNGAMVRYFEQDLENEMNVQIQLLINDQ